MCFFWYQYPITNLYFPLVALIYVNLKQELVSEDGYRRLMADPMISKFEKYWSKFNVVLAIAIVLDPHYKLCLVKYYYTKIYGVDSNEYENVHKKLTKLLWSIVFLQFQAPQLFGPQEDLDWENVNNIISFLAY
jgi:hypothetical protein